MKVKIDELQTIISLLLTELKKSMGNEIEINNDYYWNISSGEIYNPYEDPKDLTLGQLSHDLEEIKRLIHSDDHIMYDLKRIAVILMDLSVEYPIAF